MTSLKVNLKNQVKQTSLPKWKPIIPLFEAVMNSIQSIQERRPSVSGQISIEIHRECSLLDTENGLVEGFTITDNGIGLTDDNFDSFNTAFSDRKEAHGGKGLGRFTWLKAFDSADVESTFDAGGDGFLSRKFVFDERYSPDSGITFQQNDIPRGMHVHLKGFKEPYKSAFPRSVDQLVQRLVEHFLLIFIEKDCPLIQVLDQGSRYSVNDVY
jgi:hypothetical protein